MARHFTAQCAANGYSEMGGSMARPTVAKKGGGRSLGEAIEAEARKARRMAAARTKKK